MPPPSPAPTPEQKEAARNSALENQLRLVRSMEERYGWKSGGSVVLPDPGGDADKNVTFSWNSQAARAFLRKLGYSSAAEAHKENFGTYPSHRWNGWPVEMVGGQWVCLEKGQPCSRSEITGMG